jgi:predicted metal-dependent enzyme (double-stranded beta helix superfamily)
LKAFAEIGALVEERWRDKNYDEKFFPVIAAQALAESKLVDSVDPWEIIRWVHQTPALPQQMDLPAKFADPPITLYAAPRFHVDVYYWLDGTTSIHQHAFSGAFQVLHGSSVHAAYRFQIDQEINPHFLVGKLSFRDVSLLNRGDIRQINPGPEFIHSLFHLERPSVTITIRTYKAQAFPLQYSYLKPYLAINPFLVDPSLTKRVQTVSLLLHMKHPQADEFIGEIIDGTDFQTAHAVLKEAFDFLCHRDLEAVVGVTKSRDRFDALLARARKRHGELADLLSPVFEEAWRQFEIVRRRAEVKNEDHRFLMALFLNVPERTRMLELVRERYGAEDEVELVIAWLKDLAATRTFGSREPNVLGSDALTEDHFQVLDALLRHGMVELQTARVDEIISDLKAVPLLTAIIDASQAV